MTDLNLSNASCHVLLAHLWVPYRYFDFLVRLSGSLWYARVSFFSPMWIYWCNGDPDPEITSNKVSSLAMIVLTIWIHKAGLPRLALWPVRVSHSTFIHGLRLKSSSWRNVATITIHRLASSPIILFIQNISRFLKTLSFLFRLTTLSFSKQFFWLTNGLSSGVSLRLQLLIEKLQFCRVALFPCLSS